MIYPFHPAAELFPMMSEQELVDLAEDIRRQGLFEPIKLYTGMIVDGRNRLKACQIAEVEPRYIEIAEALNPYDYVWSENAERRHLVPGMKGAIFLNFSESSEVWKQEQLRLAEEANKKRSEAAKEQPRSSTGLFQPSESPKEEGTEIETESYNKSEGYENQTGQASNDAPPDIRRKPSKKSNTSQKTDSTKKTSGKKAKAAGVSVATLERAKALKETRPDLHEKVCTGEISLNAATKQMKRETPKLSVASTLPRPLALRLYVARAEALPLPNACVDIIITSPPYNIGPKGGKQEQRDSGQSVNGGRAWVGIAEEIRMPEAKYQGWQLDVLKELFRVAKPGASLFYNHKVRQQQGAMIHPMQWLLDIEGWILRQEIIWDRKSTHNHEPTYFWPHDERIYWLTKGRPKVAKDGIKESTIWSFHGPVSDTWHVSPFSEELPRRCLKAIGVEAKVVLDPFGGSMTVCKVALEMGAAQVIGCDKNPAHIHRAIVEHGWKE